ncbi:MAG TPA: DHH family phosphoesterase, partial [Verrucomicrobiae bacterium]|nr:DHH family phosphoesterase [Verrucomicrobiae bacterium]
MDSLQRVAQELKQASKVTILSHILPDGDCTGSMLALGKALKSLGKEVILVNQDRIPDYLSFLPGAEDVITPEQVTDWASLLVCVDCSDLARLGEEAWSRVKAGKIVNIDHHISNSGFGFINYVDAGAAATGQIIAKLLGHLDIPLDRELSTLLYTAIVTDTGSFQYSNTSGEVHTLAATLLATGIDVAEINVKLYDNKSISAVKLIGEALHSLEFTGDGKIAWITLPRKVLETIGATDEHTEGLINYARAINTVEVGILFR